MKKRTYIAPNATVLGDVSLGEDVSIWYGAVVRGDNGPIVIGAGTNIQDNCVVHDRTTLGACCTLGHGAIVHGATLGDHCLVGMGAIVLSGAVLGDGCLVGAGALVTGKTNAPAGSVLLGNPAKILRQLTEEELQTQKDNALHYIEQGRKAFGESLESTQEVTLC